MPNPQYIQRAKKVRMYYDPRGQVVRTVNPDATEQWVLFGTPANITGVSLNELGLPVPSSPPSQGGVGGGQTPPLGGGGASPWESYTFDANDLAPRTHPNGSGVPATHHWTPSSSLLDPLGRTVKTTDRNGSQVADEVVMQYQFDMRGNLLKVTDALNRIAFTHVYDLKPKSGEEDQGANILKTAHIDSGTKTALFDASHRPTELRDAKGALILHGYDELNRPTRIWARDNDNEDVTLRQKLIYGDDTANGPSTPTDTNHLGKLYQHYDEAGKETMEKYDFKGNVLQKKREVIADSETKAVFDGPPTDWEVPVFRVDWDSSPTLEGEYITDLEYDALNRTKKLVYPEDEDAERKVLIPSYNNAGALEKVTMDGDTYVEHIAYSASGQRLLIAFGNDVMTRYTYDPIAFRLSRMKSEKYTKNGWAFEFDSGTTKNDIAYRYDLAGNIVQMIDKTPQAAKGPDDLARNFTYDPLYRLLSATGRECDNPTPSPPWDDTPRCTDPTATRNYERRYTYDLMGNILQLKHMATGGNFNRDFNYTSATNNHLNSIDTSSTNYAFAYDVNGNMTQELTNRHFEWDHSDQLRAFYDQTGTSEPTVYEHYLYDASGNRLKKITRKNSGSHPYEVTIYVDGIYEKSYKWDGSSGYTEEKNELHIMDDKSRIAMKWVGHDDGTPEVKYILDNHLGSSNTILEDDAGATVYNREEYFPFGETSFGSFGKKRYRYVGKEKDTYSGLYYFGARYYAAWMCRFVSVDPLFAQYAQLTSYNYAGNKPINYQDIDGMQSDNGADENKITTSGSDSDGSSAQNTATDGATDPKDEGPTSDDNSSLRSPREGDNLESKHHDKRPHKHRRPKFEGATCWDKFKWFFHKPPWIRKIYAQAKKHGVETIHILISDRTGNRVARIYWKERRRVTPDKDFTYNHGSGQFEFDEIDRQYQTYEGRKGSGWGMHFDIGGGDGDPKHGFKLFGFAIGDHEKYNMFGMRRAKTWKFPPSSKQRNRIRKRRIKYNEKRGLRPGDDKWKNPNKFSWFNIFYQV